MNVVLYTLFLCVIFQLKHFLADYPLQGSYMLGKFKKEGWILPLSAHCGVHVAFTLVLAWSATRSFNVALLCAFLDGSLHFVMDRIKASPDLLGKYKALSAAEMTVIKEEIDLCQRLAFPVPNSIYDRLRHNVYFWYALGFDQLIHHLTDILIIGIITKELGLWG